MHIFLYSDISLFIFGIQLLKAENLIIICLSTEVESRPLLAVKFRMLPGHISANKQGIDHA